MPLIRNSATGKIEVVDEEGLQHLLDQGWRQPTEQEIETAKQDIQYGGLGQQVQAQAERIVRGATLGAVTGFGSDEENRARADVSERAHPIISAAADVAPDVALTLASGGLAEAGLAGAKTATRVAGKLAAESLASGAVTAGQEAYQEHRQFLSDDPVRDAANIAIWGGLGFVLGGVAEYRAFKRAEGKAAKEAVAKEVEQTAAKAEARAEKEAAPAAQAESAPAPAPAEPTPPIEETPEQMAARNRQPYRPPDEQAQVDAQAKANAAAGREVPQDSLGNPVSLVGVELKDIVPRADVGMRQETLDFLRNDERFARTGKGFHPRVTDEMLAKGEMGNVDGILLKRGSDGELSLIDGRHRITVAREREMPAIFGRVIDAKDNVIFEGQIPVFAQRVAKVAEEVADNGVERAVRNASESEADDILRKSLKGEEPVPEAPSLQRSMRLARNSDAILRSATREVSDDINIARKRFGELTEKTKPEDIAKNVSNNIGSQRRMAEDVTTRSAEFAGQLRAEARAYGEESRRALGIEGAERDLDSKLRPGRSRPAEAGPVFATPQHKSLVLSLMRHAEEIAGSKTGKEMFERIDNLKKVVDEFKVSLEQGADNALDRAPFDALATRVQQFADGLRVNLEDANVWGRAGDMQRELNAIWHDEFLPNLKLFDEATGKKAFKTYDAKWMTESWEAKISNILKGERDATAGQRRHINAMLDAMQHMAEHKAAYGTAPIEAAKDLVSRVEKIRRAFKLADETAVAKKRLQDIEGVGGRLGGTLLGGIVAGPGGAFAGAAVGGRVADLGRAIAALRGSTENMVTKSVDDWIKSSKTRAAKAAGEKSLFSSVPEVSAHTRELAKLAARRGISHTMAEFMGEDDSPHAAFDRYRKLMTDDEAMHDALAKEYGSLAAVDPNILMHLSGKAAETRQFLIQRMPPNIAVSMLNPNGYPPSKEAIEDWAIYVNSALRPRTVFESFARGDLRMQQIETLKTLYPQQYEELQGSVFDGISTAVARGTQLDDQFLMRMGLLFDIEGAGSSVFSNRAERAAALPPKQPTTSSGVNPSKMASSKRSYAPDLMRTGVTYGSEG